MLHIQLVALTLAAIALVASGCGGSSKTGSASTASVTTISATTTTPIPPAPTTTVKLATGKPLTHTKLIAEAEAICGREHTKLSAIVLRTESDYTRLAPQVAIYDSTELKELSKLVPPASMNQRWLQVITLDQTFSEYINRIANYAQAKNYNAAAPLVREVEKVREQLFALTKHDGIKNCSELS